MRVPGSAPTGRRPSRCFQRSQHGRDVFGCGSGLDGIEIGCQFLADRPRGPYFQAWYCCLQDGAAAAYVAAAAMADAGAAAGVAGWALLHAAAVAMTIVPVQILVRQGPSRSLNHTMSSAASTSNAQVRRGSAL